MWQGKMPNANSFSARRKEMFIGGFFFFFFFTAMPMKTNILYNTLYLYLFLTVLGLHYCEGFSLVVACGLLTVAPSPVEHGHESVQASVLVVHELSSCRSRSTGSMVEARRLSCSVACGIFPTKGSSPRLLHWQADSVPLSHQGSPTLYVISDLRQKLRLPFQAA